MRATLSGSIKFFIERPLLLSEHSAVSRQLTVETTLMKIRIKLIPIMS